MMIDEPIRSNTVTSDFEKFKKFFELMGIKYEIPADNLIYLSGFEVNSSQLIVIKFYEDGGFQEFCPYPEAFTHTEWLMELKDLREENKVLTSEFDRLINGELLKKSEQIAEYKRLLKAAVEDIHKKCSCECSHYKGRDCDICVNEIICDYDSRFQWVLESEALKLIEEEAL